MDERARIAWLSRRVGFGLAPGDMAARLPLGSSLLVSAWTDPVDPPPASEAPFAAVAPSLRLLGGDRARANREMVSEWVRYYRATVRPVDAFMHLFWHDHFAVSTSFVPMHGAMAQHLELLRSKAMGNYADLLRAVSTDPAMLFFLDGVVSHADAPNENFGRELLELYALGLDTFGEADVRAAARAMTGWVVDRSRGRAVFDPDRHDPTPQTLVGVDGVADVDSVIDAVVNHPACPGFIARKVGVAILGQPSEDAVAELTRVFADADLEIAPLVRAAIELGLDDQATAEPLGPVRWLVMAMKATGVQLDAPATITGLRAGGQTPGSPPNVGGFPPPPAWLGASAHVSRLRLASMLVNRMADDHVLLVALADGDLDTVAFELGVIDGLAATTKGALVSLLGETDTDPARAALMLTLTAPEVVVV